MVLIPVIIRLCFEWNELYALYNSGNDIHYNDVIVSAMASETTGVSIIYSTVWSGVDKKNHQSSSSLVFVRGIYQWPMNSPHKRPVTRKMIPFDDVIMVVDNWLAKWNRRTSLYKYFVFSFNLVPPNLASETYTYMYKHVHPFLNYKMAHLNHPLWNTRTRLFNIVNIMAIEELATQGARALAAMVLT